MVCKKDYLGIMFLGIIERKCIEGVKEKEGLKILDWKIFGVIVR